MNASTTGSTTTTGTSTHDGRLAAVRSRASDAYSAARERTSAAYGSLKEQAGTATRKTGETIDANPAAAVVGGLALGALAAVLIPVTRRETELFGEVGRRLNERAREAAQTARETGTQKLSEIGLEAVKEKLTEVASPSNNQNG